VALPNKPKRMKSFPVWIATLAHAVRPELEHDPEKWIPVFGKDHAQTKNQKSSDIRPKITL
jgi:hypothetical protein